MKTIALILAGGSGTRLWPLRRRNMPKQLLSLIGDRTLLQETCQRLFPFIPPEDQCIITAKEHYQQVLEQGKSLHESIEVMEEQWDVCLPHRNLTGGWAETVQGYCGTLPV